MRGPVRSLWSKWKKTKVLNRHKKLREYVPTTKVFSRSTLYSMLTRYRMVYIKPVAGTAGRGVIRVEQRENDKGTHYWYQRGETQKTFDSFQALYTDLQGVVRVPYIVQQGIHMLTYGNRPFDVRVMVQRTSREPWETTGYIGRLAHPNRIVTNYHSRGTPLPLEQLLGPYMSKSKRIRYIVRLRNLGLRIAKHYQTSYPGFRELGVDIAIDQKLHPWVLEVNTGPDPFIFNQLKDKRMFRKIIRLAHENGRYLKRLRRK